MSTTTPTSPQPSAHQQPDQLAVFCREVRNLLRSKPNCMIPFSKFVPAYHNHYGRQCCVYQFGYTKLIELLESIPHVVQIIGIDNGGQSQQESFNNNSNSNPNSNSNSTTSTASSGSTCPNGGTTSMNQRYITLTHREQIKRFASDLIKVVKSQPGKRLKLSHFAQAYEQVLGRTFRVLDYGTNNINVLLAEIWEGTINIIPIKRELADDCDPQAGPLFVNVPLQANKSKPVNPILEQLVASHQLVHKPYITDKYPDCWFEIPKRERSEREIKRTKYFIWDVIELLSKIKPNHSVQFSKFIPAYHYYFNRQCKVSIFGFSKLIDLFESISPDVVEIIDQGPGEEKLIQLASHHWPSPSVKSIMKPNKSFFGQRTFQQQHQQQQQQQFKRACNKQQSNSASPTACFSSNNDTGSCSSSASSSSSCYSAELADLQSDHKHQQQRPVIDNGPTEEEMLELEDELEAYEQLMRNRRSTRMAAIFDGQTPAQRPATRPTSALHQMYVCTAPMRAY